MPIIEPVPLEELSPRSWSIIEAGVEQGLHATPVPLQLFAYRTALLECTAENPTHDQLGYDPMSLDDGLRRLIPWLRDLRRR